VHQSQQNTEGTVKELKQAAQTVKK
jgi:hypothetical protein